MSVEQVVEVRGHPTRIVTAGSGRPLLWLHDTLGNRPVPVQERLAERLRVVAPTLPGFEDDASLQEIDGPEDVVFWLLDLLASLALERPLLLGCGLGGWLAAEFAVRYPERLGGLILVDAYGLAVEGALAADEFALTPALLRPLVFVEPDGPLAREWLPGQPPSERLERSVRARVAAARLAWQFPYSPKLRGRLRRVTAPALVLWGERDQLVRPAHGQAYRDGLPRARLAVLAGTGHYPYLEAPDAFLAEVERFVGEVGPA